MSGEHRQAGNGQVGDGGGEVLAPEQATWWRRAHQALHAYHGSVVNGHARSVMEERWREYRQVLAVAEGLDEQAAAGSAPEANR